VIELGESRPFNDEYSNVRCTVNIRIPDRGLFSNFIFVWLSNGPVQSSHSSTGQICPVFEWLDWTVCIKRNFFFLYKMVWARPDHSKTGPVFNSKWPPKPFKNRI
jgi:hypothetical protein